jgi:hypothetical protein
LDGRLRFQTIWSLQEKIQWCKAVRDYKPCADKHITNCSIIEVRDDVEQLSNFIDYIVKQADFKCHGKIKFLRIFFSYILNFKVVLLDVNMLLLMHVVYKMKKIFIVVKHRIQQQKL